jgi:hypothetical protein|tara:strand:+ start:6181 stop:7662 length:1482 start_codon:yes stop_codon:yes gene_type:complete
MIEHKYYNDWNQFWEFYIKSVKEDIGTKKFSVIKNNSSRIAKSIERIDDEFRILTLEPLIRKAGMIPTSVDLYYDPSATTFYSAYSRERKVFYIGYPTYTKYMCFWEPSMKAAFRHEMGHILRGDCLLKMPFSKVRNSNCCMDIRINDQLDREALSQVYKCLYFKDKEVELLVPESQFPKIDLPYNEETPYVPEWFIIANKFNKANERKKKDNIDKKPDDNKKDSFEVGDYVIIDKKSSEYKGEPGIIVDIDEKGDFIIEGISDEEFASFLEEVENQRAQGMRFVKSGEYLGIYTEKEIISAVPDEEGEQGEYGDDGDDGSPQAGGDDSGEDGEGEDGEGEDGEGDGGNKSPEDIIKEKEEILEDLINGGVDGNNQGEGVWSDELTEDENVSEDTKEGSKKDKESKEKEDGEGDSSEDKDSEKEGSEEEISWTDEQLKRKKELEEKIEEINLNVKIKSSIDNFKNIKNKHEGKLTREEMSNIDKALAELQKLI